jgi:hypothetical protein
LADAVAEAEELNMFILSKVPKVRYLVLPPAETTSPAMVMPKPPVNARLCAAGGVGDHSGIAVLMPRLTGAELEQMKYYVILHFSVR